MGDLSEREDQLLGKKPEAPEKGPIDTLSTEKLAALKELRNLVDQWKGNYEKEVQDFLDDVTLFRYLDGFAWDINLSNEKLRATSEWRQKERPQDIRLKDLGAIGKTGFIMHQGYDRERRPIIYVNFQKDTLEINDENNKLRALAITYMVERCIRRMPDNVYQITWCVDMRNANVGMAMVRSMKDPLLVLGEHCAERLSVALVCNVSWTLNLCWNFVRPFLSQQTLDRYHVMRQNDSDPSIMKGILNKFISDEVLLKEFGGKNEYKYDYEALLKLEEDMDQAAKQN
jgi:hypothetical protein